MTSKAGSAPLLDAQPAPRPRSATIWWPALTGVVAGALTIAVAELIAALLVRTGHTHGTPSPVVALGQAFIDRTPPWLKDFAVSTFGTHDKTALLTSIAVVVTVVAAVAGIVAARNRLIGLLVVVTMAAVAGLAVLSRPKASGTDLLPLIVGTVVGLFTLSYLTDQWTRTQLAVSNPTPSEQLDASLGRRAFLRGLVGAGGAAVLAAVGSQVIAHASRAVQASRAALRLPAPTGPTPTPAELASLEVSGISPMVTPPDDFYRIDTALSVPQLSTQDWKLRVHGMVANEIELSFADLLALPMIERMTTLTCVSNEVGGELIGNQVWLGHPIRELLARAVPSADADMVLSTSIDGFTAGTPLDALTDDNRDALLAIAMSGQPLPVEHGFPVRMVVPGLYGYVSATKWVVDLEVTRFDRDEGYWTPRGWSPMGPIKTGSRIDVPRGGRVDPGKVAVAGIAWAQHRGIDKVEVRVDEGAWQPARLGEGGTKDSWKQWVFEWDATKGEHTLQVRATDGQDDVQTGQQATPAPNGATGWDTVTVTVN
ncbi:molybdopterin-dependent oxidoreductase [Angustibacter sp. McL0619]|uniref:molybdopterin-dependent oxidoreductase n=1 Tax=Angustibacter sp. McL0619 TaxID=3415676 RepID=UPI003CEA3AF6